MPPSLMVRQRHDPEISRAGRSMAFRTERGFDRACIARARAGARFGEAFVFGFIEGRETLLVERRGLVLPAGRSRRAGADDNDRRC